MVPLDALLERGLKEEEEEEARIKDSGEKADVEEERKGSDEMRKLDDVLKEQREDRNKGAEQRKKEEVERRDPKDGRAECDDERKEDEDDKEERNEEEVALTPVDKSENGGEAHENEKMDSRSTSEQDLPLQQQTQPHHQQPQHQQPHEQQPLQQPEITRLSIAKYLQPHQSVFLPPSTHIFSGAEVAYRIKMTSEDEGGGGGGGGGGGEDDDDLTSSSDDSSSGSDREEEDGDRGGKRNDEEESKKAMDVPEEAKAEERDSAEPAGFAEIKAEDGDDARRRLGEGGADIPSAPSEQQKDDK